MRLLIQCGDNLENTRRVLALAAFLRDAGHQPVAGVYTERYAGPFKALGLETVAVVRFRPKVPGWKPTRELGFEPEIGTLFPIDRALGSLYGGFSIARRQERSAITHLLAAKRTLEASRADGIIVWNGVTGIFANAFRCLKDQFDLPGGFIERGLIGDGLYFDHIGTNGWSSTANGAQLGTEAERAERRQRHEEALSAHFPSLVRDVFLERASRERPKTVFVPLQVQRDSNILLHSARIKTMRALVEEAIWLRDRWFPDHEVLVRPHPEEREEELIDIRRVDKLRISSDGNLREILADAPVTVTVNSTVGLEAALEGSLPIVCGESIYSNEPFVFRHQPGTPSDPRPKCAQMREAPEQAWREITDFMNALLDRNLIQPLRRTMSHPLGLLPPFGPAQPVGTDPYPLVFQQARDAFETEGGPVHCHMLAQDRPVNLDYRRLAQPIEATDVSRMLGAILKMDRPIAAGEGAWSDRRDIAIADPSPVAVPGYRLVLTPNFNLHPGHGPGSA